MKLYDRAKKLIEESSKTNREVAEAINVSISWVEKFKSGSSPGGDVHTVQALHDFLDQAA